MKEKILSRYTPFLDLTKPENLKKININKKLADPFINVMKKFQVFFDRNNLLSASNYALMFEKFFLSNGKNKYSIEIKDTKEFLDGESASGLFSPADKKIIIDENYFNKCVIQDNKKDIETVLTHEFIHFLASADLPWIETKDGNFVQYEDYFQENFVSGGFVNEGFTQMITELIDPNNIAYFPNTSMMKSYLNVFSTKDFFHFFRGRLPGRTYESEKLDKFLESAERQFRHNFYEGGSFTTGHSWEEEIMGPYYQETFNLLVDVFKEKVGIEIMRFNFGTTEDFVERMHSFKSTAIFESAYLYSAINELTTDFVETYFGKESIDNKFKIKKEINYLIEEYEYNEPGIEAIYTSYPNEQGYYIKLKVYDKYLLMENYSPDSVLLNKETIFKMDGVSGQAHVSSGVAKNETLVNFAIKNYIFYFTIIDESFLKLTEKDIAKLKKSELPTTYKIDVFDYKEKNKVKESNKIQRKVFYNLNNLIDQKNAVVMEIVRRDEGIVSVFEIKDVYPEDSSATVFLAATHDNNFRFYFANKNGCFKVKNKTKNSASIPFNIKSQLDLHAIVVNNKLRVESFSENNKLKLHNPTPYYYTSKSYINNIADRKEYKTLANYEDDLQR